MPSSERDFMPHYIFNTKGVEAIDNDRSIGHRLVMSLLPDNCLDKKAPRSQAGILWKIYEDGLFIRSKMDIPGRPGLIELEDTLLSNNFDENFSGVIDVTMSRVQRESLAIPQELIDAGYKPKKARTIPVPEDYFMTYAERKLDGFSLNDVEFSDVGRIVVGRGAGKYSIPSFRVKAQVTINDFEKAYNIVYNGVGKGKNFGLGLVTLNSDK